MINQNIENLIISTRIRLARNFKGELFGKLVNETHAKENIKDVFYSLNENKDFSLYYIDKLSSNEKELMFEKHLISRNLMGNNRGAVILNKEETISVMINEEDHLRLQCILEGYKLRDAYDKLNELDEIILNDFEIAHDDTLGFLTSCISNVGTGLRASCMVFLPALTKLNRVKLIFTELENEGLTIRGEKGEGSVADGDLYQISNEQTLGLTEDEILEKLEKYIKKICEAEIEAEKELLEKFEIKTKDEVCRAVGVFSCAATISHKEFIKLCSDIKLGILLDLISVNSELVFDSRKNGIKNFSNLKTIDNLIAILKRSSIRYLDKSIKTEDEENIYRANYLRKFMQRVAVNI